MLPVEHEKLVVGTCLSNPNGRLNIPEKVVTELDPSRFGDAALNKIYLAIKNCVHKKIVPNTANVALELGRDLEECGGIEYLESLCRFPNLIGTMTPDGIENWVRYVDWNGRARHLHLVLNQRIGMSLEDFQSQISNSFDPDEALNSILKDLDFALSGSQGGYKHISEVVAQAREHLRMIIKGEVVEIIPCGWPNLQKYMIPRPRSFGIIIGISSMGKTQFAIQIALGVAILLQKTHQAGYVAINTLEQTNLRLLNRLAFSMAGIDSLEYASGRLSSQQLDKVEETYSYLESLPVLFNDDVTITSGQLVSHAIASHLRNPRILGVSDYTELFKDKGDNEERRVASICHNIRTICWHTGSCELLLSQNNDDAIRSSYKVGGFFSTRQSRSLAHANDFTIEILNYPQMRKSQIQYTVPDGRNDQYAYALIEKNRDYPVGEEPFEWIAEYTRFRDVSLPIGKIYQDEVPRVDF